MASRLAIRSLSPALRRAAPRQARSLAPRHMSSSAHGAPKSSDTAWLVGSALVFIPTIGYLLSPSARSKPHQVHSAAGHGEPRAPAENTPSQPAPEPTKSGETIADAEGTEVPAEEVKESIEQAVRSNAPKEAAQAEAENAEATKYDNGAPGQTSEAETDHEQKEKPHDEPKKGTLQSDEDTQPQPTDLSKAREQSKQGKDPKDAAKSEDSQ
ncbi:hypothetical protein BC834DRAFT_863391 [Gloeopeniophorella convolvens]|nr:hypothetical protein BC834DRAFT_863391 [Gloeopeniophorella convolvens]